MDDYNIKQLYEEMEKELITSMQRNLKRHLAEEKKVGFKFSQWQSLKLKELKRYEKENKNIINSSTKGLNKHISDIMKRELKQGRISAIKQYNKISKKKIKIDSHLNNSFFKTNDRKVNALIKVVNNDLSKANSAALRMVNDQYRQVIYKSVFFDANGIMSEKKAIDLANKNFLQRGINCIEYKNGRRVNIASYSEMAVRTASLRAHLMGEGDFRQSIGKTLVKVTTHGGACKLCSGWQGRVLIDDVYSGGQPDGKHTLLSEAMNQGFLHPNCRHGITTYYPELDNINESYEDEQDGSESDQQYLDDINYINRNIKRFDRLQLGYIDPINKKDAKEKLIAWENRKKDVVMIKINNPKFNWLNDVKNEKGLFSNQDFVIGSDHNKYVVDNKNVIFDHTKSEEAIAKWFAKTKKINVKMLPRVLFPKNVKVGDFIEETSQKVWEIKEPEGSTIATTIANQFKGQKEKAKSFIIDIHRSNMTIDQASIEINQIFKNNRYNWIEEVVLMKDMQDIKYFKR